MRPRVSQGSLAKIEILFSDDVFIPSFGVSFTDLSAKHLEEIYGFLIQLKKNRRHYDEMRRQYYYLKKYICNDKNCSNYNYYKRQINQLSKNRNELLKKFKDINSASKMTSKCEVAKLSFFDQKTTLNSMWPSEKKLIKELKDECEIYLTKRKIKEEEINSEKKITNRYSSLKTATPNKETYREICNIRYSVLPKTSSDFKGEWESKITSLFNYIEGDILKILYEELGSISPENYKELTTWREKYNEFFQPFPLEDFGYEKDIVFTKKPFESIHSLFIEKIDKSIFIKMPEIEEEIKVAGEEDLKRIKSEYLIDECRELAIYAYNIHVHRKIKNLDKLNNIILDRETEIRNLENEKLVKEREKAEIKRQEQIGKNNEKNNSDKMCECCSNTPRTCLTCHGDGLEFVYDWTLKANINRRCFNCGGRGWKVCPCCKKVDY